MAKSSPKSWKTQALIPLLVIVAAVWAYHDSLCDAFVFDDIPHISENLCIRRLWPPWDVLSHSSRPVVNLSVAVNYALGGLNPRGYHVFNVAVHIFVALTLYGVVRRTLLSQSLPPAFGRAAWPLAGAATLIWLVHPLQTESVTYTIQRGESLMSLFYLLTLYCVIRSDGASRENWWRIGAVVSCALGMACKPVMVTAPLVTLLYDRAFLVKSWREVWRRRGWLYAGLAASWLLLPPLLANAPTEWKASAGFEFQGIPPLQYARMESVAIVRYLRLAFGPHPLCLDYGWRYHWQKMMADFFGPGQDGVGENAEIGTDVGHQGADHQPIHHSEGMIAHLHQRTLTRPAFQRPGVEHQLQLQPRDRFPPEIGGRALCFVIQI